MQRLRGEQLGAGCFGVNYLAQGADSIFHADMMQRCDRWNFSGSELGRKFVDNSEVISLFSDYGQLVYLSRKNRLYFCGNSQGGCGIRFIMHATRHILRRQGKSHEAASRYCGVVGHCHVVEYNIYSFMGTCVANAANLAWGAQHVFIIRGGIMACMHEEVSSVYFQRADAG